jgi:hypothetical protein
MEAEVRAVLKEFRSGDKEAAFFELLEMPGDVLPIMIDIFRSERLSEVRAFLVKVAWQRRDESVISFLGEALNAAEEEIWQEALDGLVTFSSQESLQVLQSARSRKFANDSASRHFHVWLEEAIQQIEFELRAKLNLAMAPFANATPNELKEI